MPLVTQCSLTALRVMGSVLYKKRLGLMNIVNSYVITYLKASHRLLTYSRVLISLSNRVSSINFGIEQWYALYFLISHQFI